MNTTKSSIFLIFYFVACSIFLVDSKKSTSLASKFKAELNKNKNSKLHVNKNLKKRFNNPTIVIDLGSGFIKAGLAGEDSPRVVFPSVIGTSRDDLVTETMGLNKNNYIGNDAIAKRSVLYLRYPIIQGIINNWDDFELIITHIFSELRLFTDNQSILLTRSPMNSKQNQQRMIEILFNKFNVSAVSIVNTGVLSLYSAYLETGLSIDSGEGVTYIVPVYRGSAISNAIVKLEFAGGNITNYLMNYLKQQGIRLLKEIVEEVKQDLCYVALDFNKEMWTPSKPPKSFYLSDGPPINLEKERFRAPEAMFQPNLIGIQSAGIHKAAYDSIMKCEDRMRSEISSGIVLTGGNTMFPGFTERMQMELSRLGISNEIEIVESVNRKYGTWLGGAIFASMSNYPQKAITRNEWDQYGQSILERKVI